jgi:PadR family transcriptional regulator, regulatory protein PadR
MYIMSMHKSIMIPPGTLEMLILKTLHAGPLHGYAIAKQIKAASEDLLKVEEGSLYPALQRLLRKGLVNAKWVPAGQKRRARVYQVTPLGLKQFAADADEFTRVFQMILRVIQPA